MRTWISQDSATSWVQVPMLDRKAPAHSRRKLRKENPARTPGQDVVDVGSVALIGGFRAGYTRPVTFACPGCEAVIEGRPERPARRCRSCGALLRSRPLDTGGELPGYELEVVGRPETRRRVEVAWDEEERRRLSAWLLWSSLLTVLLVVALYALARLVR